MKITILTRFFSAHGGKSEIGHGNFVVGGEFEGLAGLGIEFNGSGTLRAPSWIVLGANRPPSPPFGGWTRYPPEQKVQPSVQTPKKIIAEILYCIVESYFAIVSARRKRGNFFMIL